MQVNADGSYVYTAPVNMGVLSTTGSFVCSVSDGLGGTASATVNLNLQPVPKS